MNLTPALFGAVLTSLCSVAAAAPLAADSKISAVTVYTDRAIVTRNATLNVSTTGIVEVTFDRLPVTLMEQSLQVTGRGAARVSLLDVTARPVFVAFTPNERVKALEDDLRSLAREDRQLADRLVVLGQQRDYVLKIQTATTSPTKDSSGSFTLADTWTKLLSFSEDQLTKIAAEQQTVEKQREELQVRRDALEQQLNELRGQTGRSYKTVTVRLSAVSTGALELTVRYILPGTSWTPSYDARVISADRSVQLGYFGIVRQSTGEDWNQVDLTLSTARPSLGGAAPALNPWIVEQREIRPLAAAPAQAQRSRKLHAVADETAVLSPFEIGAGSSQIADAGYVQAQVDQQATSASFRIQTPSTVPSDNSPQKVPVTTASLTADLEYSATPKQVPAAYLAAKVSNTSEFPLLAGAMNVFLDDTFVASSSLPSVMPGEKFDLALGADDGITVKRKLNNRFTEDTGLVNKSKRITYDITLTVQNNKKTAEKLVLRDQVPISRHEKIVVKVLSPTEREMKPEADGTLKWTFTLNPGEKRDIPLKFSIEYPNDFPVIGLE